MKKTVPVDERFARAWPGARDGVTPDGRRSIVVGVNTDSPIPEPGAPALTRDMTAALIERALCG